MQGEETQAKERGMEIGRIVREVEVIPDAEPDRAPLTEPEPERQPEPAEPG